MAASIRHPTLGDKVYDKLKNMILSGRIRPGERLNYARLVEGFGKRGRLLWTHTPTVEEAGELARSTRSALG